MKAKSSILFYAAILLLLIIILLFTYEPVFYDHHCLCAEDYFYVWAGGEKTVDNQSFIEQLREIAWEGKPLHTIYTYLIFNKHINPLASINAANSARLIGVIGTGLLAYVLFLIFKINRFRTDHAFLLSLLICTLPPMQTYVGRVYTVDYVYSVPTEFISTGWSR